MPDMFVRENKSLREANKKINHAVKKQNMSEISSPELYISNTFLALIDNINRQIVNTRGMYATTIKKERKLIKSQIKNLKYIFRDHRLSVIILSHINNKIDGIIRFFNKNLGKSKELEKYMNNI